MASFEELSNSPPLSWPEWLLTATENIPQALRDISELVKRLKDKTPEQYVYKHVFQQQLHRVQDPLVKSGIVTPGKPVEVMFEVPDDYAAAYFQNIGSGVRMFSQLCVVKRMACIQLLECACSSANNRSLLACLICMRSVLEHIAHFASLVSAIDSYKPPTQFEEANAMWGRINELVIKGSYGSSVDWLRLVDEDIDALLEKNQVKYRPRENRADLSVKSIMNAIDALDDHIKGVRAIYEVLSDFAHPNVGPLLCLIESGKPPTRDEKDVFWIEKVLSLRPPLETVRQLAPVLSRIFFLIRDSLQHFEKLVDGCDKQRNIILEITQVLIRAFLKKQRDLVDPYSLCPCGSGVKVKFCCEKQR
jgi:hypothetical protein